MQIKTIPTHPAPVVSTISVPEMLRTGICLCPGVPEIAKIVGEEPCVIRATRGRWALALGKFAICSAMVGISSVLFQVSFPGGL
jgi:hypothetical protein